MKNPLSQRGNRLEFDVLVFGSGIAGLTYVLDFSQLNPKARIALITKKELSESNSRYAQGGIAAVSTQEDSFDAHVQDTLKAGDGLCHEHAVRKILKDAPKRIEDLIHRGVQFDLQKDSKGKSFDLALEGGHSRRRVYRSGDQTGQEIIQNLQNQVRKNPQVEIFENHTAINLITQGEEHEPGSLREVLGAYVLDEEKNVVHTFLSKVTILATGGSGKIYRYTTNPEVATGDGIAMAYRAGARVGNLEFIQFHPTLLFHQKLNNFLITEALRGEGAHLLLPDSGERFMKRYEPQKMELATRDIVARAIFSEIERGNYNHVYLDIRHRDKDFLTKHFPGIFKTLESLGLDISKDLIPVVPAAHYLCGGVLTNTHGKTDLHRLYILGESAFTGFHGANRLASNSLIEGVVMAHNAARETAGLCATPFKHVRQIHDWDSESVTDLRRLSQINAHWRGLRGEMTSYAGIVRTEAGLKDLAKLIATRKAIIEDYYWTHEITRDLIELRNIVLLSEIIVRSALNRRESRGVHFREDYPEKLSFRANTLIRFSEVFPISTNPFERPSE